VPRVRLGKPQAPDCLHMLENVESMRAPGQKTKATQAVEPFYCGTLPVAFPHHHDIGTLRQLRGMDRGRIVHGTDAERLQALRPAQHLAHHARALVGSLKAVAPQTRHMQENVWKIFVWDDEAIAL